MKHFDVLTQPFPRSLALTRACPGERIADSAGRRSTDTELGHSTFRTLENASTSALSERQAADLGRLVRRIVNSPGGLPDGFDTVEDLCRSHLTRQLSAPTVEQSRSGMQRTLDLLRSA